MARSAFTELEVHPLHGISNRVFGVISAILLAFKLDAHLGIDWRINDSKYTNAQFSALFDARLMPTGVKLTRRPVRRYFSPLVHQHDRCDAWIRQDQSGWFQRNDDGGGEEWSPGGGGFASNASLALEEHVRRRLPACNESQVALRGLTNPRDYTRPGFQLESVVRDGCGAHFRGFELTKSCARAPATRGEDRLKLGLSLWSPIVPLDGACAYAVLPPSPEVHRKIKWLPQRTLGVHVRRGNLDASWPRAKWDEWFEAVERVCRRENLRYLFLASDDEGTYSAFAEHYRRAVDGSARNASSHLPELLPAFVDKALPRGNSIAERRQMWSRDGNVASLAEQLTLATADFVLGTWGSTYSSLAAAWFDRPIEFVPAKPERCRHATHEHPCFWRGDPLYPTPDWDYGSLCRKVIHKLEVRRKQVVPGPRSKPPRPTNARPTREVAGHRKQQGPAGVRRNQRPVKDSRDAGHEQGWEIR